MARLKQIGKMFPTLKSQIASYDPATFYISLENISESDLNSIRAKPFTPQNIEHIKTLFHEIRHSVDHIATLWGQKQMLQYLKAINVRISQDLANFKEIITYKNQDSQLFYTNYFTQEFNYIPVDRLENRWQWTASVGARFDAYGKIDEKRPIPFIHFRSADGVPLMRVPLSIASLLETNSTSEEIKWHLTYLLTFSETERPFHLKFFADEVIYKLLYNQDLALYNVAVHLAANILHLADFTEAFQISSSIATLALNLPYSLVEKLPVNRVFTEWGERPQSMLNNNEHGFIYYLLLQNYADEFAKTKKFNIEELLKASGLPEEKEIQELVLKEMDSIIAEANQFENLKEVFLPNLIKGKNIFKTLGICFKSARVEEAILMKMPTLICNDTHIDFKSYRDSELFSLFPIQSLTLSEWYNISLALNVKLTQVYEVRGV